MSIIIPSKDTLNGFVFMKVGSHAGEDLDTIMERKQREIDKTGRSFWGYGGSSCHPVTQVQPFAQSLVKNKVQILLMMEYIHSVANPKIVPATRYSANGVDWQPIPEGINVTGSRYALVLGEIIPGDLEIPFDEFAVALGNSKGKVATDYLRGHVDKACLIRASAKSGPMAVKKIRKISYIGKLIEPYGVYVK